MAFLIIGADPGRQDGFVERFRVGDGLFAGLGGADDPLAGQEPSPQEFGIAARPFWRKAQGIPPLGGLRCPAEPGEQG
ncbi:MAG: hypothetical protein ACKOWF_05950 [Chloroflexota bacterium]